ncbi:MAG: hypothetical protein KDJ88_12800 [Bauldia sp.]|nr:hypothetical protein [Bauldia sp.]
MSSTATSTGRAGWRSRAPATGWWRWWRQCSRPSKPAPDGHRCRRPVPDLSGFVPVATASETGCLRIAAWLAANLKNRQVSKVTKIIAHQPLAPDFLEQLGKDVDSGPAKIHDRSSHGFVVTQGNKVVLDFHFEGNGIKYIGGVPYRGTVNKVTIDLDGELAYKFTGESFSVSKGLDLYLENDPWKIVKVLTRGDDKVTLSDFDDDLNVGKGDDRVSGNGGNDIIRGGKGNDNLRGGPGDDTLKGGAGKDLLDGGTGNNILDGGSGLDTYVFKSAPTGGVSTISNWQAGETIKIDNGAFAGIGGKGGLGAKYFHSGTDADSADVRIVHDSTTGAVYYDPDGNGAAAKVQFAQVKAGVVLSHDDFMVI